MHWLSMKLSGASSGIWALGDQAVSSGTNLVMLSIVARSTTVTEFGAFSASYALYILLLACSQALTSEPLIVNFSGSRVDNIRAVAIECMGGCLIVGLFLSPCLFLVSYAFPSGLSHVGQAFALVLPVLLMFDCWRFVMFTLDMNRFAFVGDLVWGLILIAAISVLSTAGSFSATIAIICWGLSALVALSFMLFWTRLYPGIHLALGWFRSQRKSAAFYLGENVAAIFINQVGILALGVILGLPAIGALRTSEAVLGPVNIVTGAARGVGIAEIGRLSNGKPLAQKSACVKIAMLLSVFGFAWGALTLLVPSGYGSVVFGESWLAAQQFLPALIISKIAFAAVTGSFVGMRLKRLNRVSMYLRVGLAALATSSAIGFSLVFGVTGAAVAIAVTSTFSAVVWWSVYLKTFESEKRSENFVEAIA